MQTSDYIAWWGAVVATVVFIWDIAKWIKDGPVIMQRVQLNTVYPDGRILSTEKTEYGESKELAEYCHIELVNKGKLPTTIMGVCAKHTKSKNSGEVSFSNERFTPHYGKTLPHVLGAGEVWSCRLEMSDLYILAKRGRPYVDVFVSHRRKPITISTGLKASV